MSHDLCLWGLDVVVAVTLVGQAGEVELSRMDDACGTQVRVVPVGNIGLSEPRRPQETEQLGPRCS